LWSRIRPGLCRRRRVRPFHALPCVARTPRPGSPGYLRPRRPRDPPHPCPSRRVSVRRRRPQTLAAAAVDSPPPPLSRRREAVQVLHLEVRNPPTSLVAVLASRNARKPSPDFAALAESRRLVACPRRRFSAATAIPVGFAAPRAARRSSLRFKPGTRALVRVHRRTSPPSAAAAARRRLCPAASRLQTFLAAGSRSDAPDLIPPHRFTREQQQPLDLGPTDLGRVNRVNQVKRSRPWIFCRKPPVFADIHKNILPL
jgi:hypothetical protein